MQKITRGHIIGFGTLAGTVFLVFFLIILIHPSRSQSTEKVLGESVYSTEPGAFLKLSPENILYYVNQERARAELAPLRLSELLNETATAKNNDMKKYNYFEHENPITHNNFDFWFDQKKYSFLKGGENLAMGNFSHSKEVVDAWMKSPSHRKNILDPAYRDMGISIQSAIISNESTLIITQHFGNPRSNCPSVNSSKKNTIALLQEQLVTTGNKVAEQKDRIAIYEEQNNVSDELYNNAIELHNSLVEEYNELAQKIEQLAAAYNDEVHAFEQCIANELL